MKKYSDEENAKGVFIIFAVVQMILLALMYTIVYASYKATEMAVEKFGLSEIPAFAPTIIVFFAVPLLLYRTRKIFLQGRMMEAILWMMGLLSVLLVGLMMHVTNITGV